MHWIREKFKRNSSQLSHDMSWENKAYKRVSMGLTDRRKTAKNLVDSRKNWKNFNR